MSLGTAERRLLRFFVLVVLGEREGLLALRESAPPGEPDRAWREALLQAVLFAGFPRVVEAAQVLTRAGGLGDPEPDEVEGDAFDPTRGRELFDRIYGSQADAVRDLLSGVHPDLGLWIDRHAYGRTLGRPGLSADRRELLAVVGLAATGQDRQLASHARGAVRCGATPAEVHGALDAVADLVRADHLQRAREVVLRFAGEAV